MSGWNVIQASALDHPNVVEDREVIPGGPSVAWIEDVRDEYGEGSPYYVARVLGQFPESATDALIRRSWLEQAVSPERHEALKADLEDEHMVLGVDPARRGPDATVVAPRQGRVVHELISWRDHDTAETAERVERIVARFIGEENLGVASVWTDMIGLGSGVHDRLKELLPKHEWSEIVTTYRNRFRTRSPSAKGFNSSRASHLSDRFRNLRAQGYWHLRDRLEAGEIALPDDPALIEELWAQRVEFTADGKIQIQAKDDLKSRIGRSPDRADAVMMSFAPELDRGRRKLRTGR